MYVATHGLARAGRAGIIVDALISVPCARVLVAGAATVVVGV